MSSDRTINLGGSATGTVREPTEAERAAWLAKREQAEAARPRLYGWVSERQSETIARLDGSGRGRCGSIYSTPDGREVFITCVTNDPANHHTGWEDIYPVGEVVRWLRCAY